jgi:hypothetical protein
MKEKIKSFLLANRLEKIATGNTVVDLAINLAMIYYSVVVLYNGNFWYGYNAEGHITISPLSASVIVILLGIVPYFFQKSKAQHVD